MQSNNPALNRSDWGRGQRIGTVRDLSPADLQRSYDAPAYVPVHDRVMTVDDVVMRTLAMLGILATTGALTWFGLGDRGNALALPAALVGLVLAMFVIFKQSTNPALILTYAAVEGVVLGAISRAYDQRFSGIVIQAVIATAAVFGGMLIAYRAKWIRATPKFTRWLTGAMFGVLALMVINLLGSLIGGGNGLGLRSPGAVGIGFSLLCIGIAALTFILDFESVEQGVRAGAPERYSWYAAFGIVVGLVWLYLEILRLLGYARR